jgi:hypothetical protein
MALSALVGCSSPDRTGATSTGGTTSAGGTQASGGSGDGSGGVGGGGSVSAGGATGKAAPAAAAVARVAASTRLAAATTATSSGGTTAKDCGGGTTAKGGGDGGSGGGTSGSGVTTASGGTTAKGGSGGSPAQAARQLRAGIPARAARPRLRLRAVRRRTGTGPTGPCDIYQTAGTPCGAAHSTVRALYASYSGPLYQVQRASDKTTKDIVVGPGGFAQSSDQDSFCSGTTCTIPIIYDQSPNGNHLRVTWFAYWLQSGGNPATANAAKIRWVGIPSTASSPVRTSPITRACSCRERPLSPTARRPSPSQARRRSRRTRRFCLSRAPRIARQTHGLPTSPIANTAPTTPQRT